MSITTNLWWSSKRRLIHYSTALGRWTWTSTKMICASRQISGAAQILKVGIDNASAQCSMSKCFVHNLGEGTNLKKKSTTKATMWISCKNESKYWHIQEMLIKLDTNLHMINIKVLIIHKKIHFECNRKKQQWWCYLKVINVLYCRYSLWS